MLDNAQRLARNTALENKDIVAQARAHRCLLAGPFAFPARTPSHAAGASHREKKRLNMLPATLRAMPLDWNALEARLDAWLKRSHFEKATVLVIVRTRATATPGTEISQRHPLQPIL